MNLSVFRVFLHKMSSTGQSLLTPLNVRGMKVLDRAKFLRNVPVPILKVNKNLMGKINIYCKPFYMKVENFRPVRDLQNGPYQKYICLHPDKITKWEDLPESMRENLKQYDVTENNFFIQEEQLGYENWSYEIIFKSVFPVDTEIISGYSRIGHIIHLNLRDHLLEYRHLIGQVFIDKIKGCRTVVNKSKMIDNTYRNFSMELIGGEEDYIVTVKENCCNFQFDFSKVYWNPRLGMEHERILTYLRSADILFDVFCGVGPFAIPAIKRKCKVFANDLNPESFKWLNHNAKLNNLNLSKFKAFNLDGKDFILNVLKEYLIEICKNKKNLNGSRIVVTMNLPALAVEFVKYFKGLIKDKELANNFNFQVVVFVYCFAFGDLSECELSAKQMLSDNMGCDMSPYIVDVFDVRNVSPKKEMMRITFKLTKEIIFDLVDSPSIEEPPLKKQCVE